MGSVWEERLDICRGEHTDRSTVWEQAEERELVSHREAGRLACSTFQWEEMFYDSRTDFYF